jgi:hypothetical protein
VNTCIEGTPPQIRGKTPPLPRRRGPERAFGPRLAGLRGSTCSVLRRGKDTRETKIQRRGALWVDTGACTEPTPQGKIRQLVLPLQAWDRNSPPRHPPRSMPPNGTPTKHNTPVHWHSHGQYSPRTGRRPFLPLTAYRLQYSRDMEHRHGQGRRRTWIPIRWSRDYSH